MPSIEELVLNEELFTVDPSLSDGEIQIRFLYLLPTAKEWLERNLSSCTTDGFFEGAVDPEEQADNFFHDFSADMSPTFDMEPHIMRPEADSVWELRTADLRFFGWFWRVKTFFVSYVNTKEQCMKHGLYNGYLNETKRVRNQLNIDPPPFITGTLNDLL